MEDDQMRNGYPKVGESMLGYLVHCHKKNSEGIMCPRCSLIYDRKAAETYEKIRNARTGGNWRKDDQIEFVSPKAGESLLGFLVHYHKKI